MSKIGKKPIEIPNGVKVEIKGREVSVSGPLGSLSLTVRPELIVSLEDSQMIIAGKSRSKFARSLHGLTRSLIDNMVKGVSTGWQKELELIGVGYRSRLEGGNLILSLGFSHPVTIKPPPDISFETRENTILVKGVDKQLVGQVAAAIRKIKPPEPYKGKGVRYAGERVRKKVGKIAKAVAFGS